MKNFLTTYDLRQLILMEKKIILFEENKIHLYHFITDLQGLLNALEAIPESWKHEFQKQLNELELIYDVIEEEGISKWKGNYKEDMQTSINKIKNMTSLILENYLENSDVNISEKAEDAGLNWLICPKCNDAWETDSLKAMVICPNCESALHNPRLKIS